MPAGDRRHRKEAGRSDPADPVRRLQRDGRRVRARLVAFHVRARMNPMTSKKTTAAAEPVTRALSFSSRTAERERAVFCPAVLPRTFPAIRTASCARNIVSYDLHGQKKRFKRPADVCSGNFSGLAGNGKEFGLVSRRTAGVSRTQHFDGHTETDADEIAEPCAFRRSETEHTVSTQTRRRRMNTRNDRICLNPNEYYTKTTI